MPRNRRDDASMRRAVGCGCLRLLFAVVGLGFSFVKVIFGAEFISKCPSSDIVPVYIVVSGCLPVLLSSLKEPYDDAGDSRKCESRTKLAIASFAIAVNLAWLIAGTLWTTSLLADSDYGKYTCARIHGNNSESYSIDSDTNRSMGTFERQNNNVENYTLSTVSARNLSRSSVSIVGNDVEKVAMDVDLEQMHVNSFNAHDKVSSQRILHHNGTYTTTKQTYDNTHIPDDLYHISTKTTPSVLGKKRDNTTSSMPVSTTGREPRCVFCSVEVVIFALACVVCDWTMFGVGTLYLLYLTCHKVARMKHDWLIISTL